MNNTTIQIAIGIKVGGLVYNVPASNQPRLKAKRLRFMMITSANRVLAPNPPLEFGVDPSNHFSIFTKTISF